MKHIFLLFFLVCQLLALDISPQIVPVHAKIEMAQNIGNIKEAISSSKKFETVKYFRRYLRKKRDNNNLWLKLSLHNPTDIPLQRELVMRWERVNVDVYLVDKEEVIFQERFNKKKYHCVSSPMVIPPSKSVTLYLHVNVPKDIDDFYYLYITEPTQTQDFIIKKEKYYHNGFFLGVLLTMMFYNFFMYFSVKEKSYFLLALYQFSIVFYISDLRLFVMNLLEPFPEFSYWFLKVGSSVLISFLSMLFTKEFLNMKKNMPFLNNALNISFVVLAFFQLNAQISNYAAFLYLLYMVAGLYAFYKGNFFALFFTFGFSGIVFFTIGLNVIKIFELNLYFEYQSVIQVLACIEAFALSMAMYLKIKSIIQEKEYAQAENIKQEKIILEQSRFATMGEMLASIAHQWRQPLNHLSLILNNIYLANRLNKLDNKYLNQVLNEGYQQLDYMSMTVEDFSNFFSKKGQQEKFQLKEVCEYAIELVESRLNKHQIVFSIESSSNYYHTNYKNELIQVLTVVLNNAIDALTMNNIENRQINMTITSDSITIEDNAGGIPDMVLPKIFDPYFSTKDKKFGTGLGLYTAKIIVDTLIHGRIEVNNSDIGAKFVILLPQVEKENKNGL
ncbi:sensor histidine kinase [Sulfurospirillum arcachonense]|uniref:sensor histidine kinase n=1 Tax=Sulfurospirillum arcachonense TaxID=57666 RepID=UPI00046AE5E4|nr:sensor histidine kinase [Sulfurospirillum arcachonense]